MKTIVLIALISLLEGCTTFQNDAQRGYAVEGDASGPRPGLIVTTADVRLVIRRRNPITHQMVTCTEPSPDIAAALSTATELTLKGGNKAANGQFGFTGASAEAVTELAGRTTALLALRDGLYRTCEAYANGALGAEAYALVLARYGQLMTTLFLGQDVASAAAAAPQGAPSSPAAATSPALVNLTPQGTGSPPRGNPSPSTPPATSHTPPASQGTNPSDPPSNSAAGATGVQSGSDNASQNGKPTTKLDPTAPAKSRGTRVSSPSGPGGAAASLVRMNEDYFDLDRRPIQLLIVACINEYDETGFSAKNPDPWLRKICQNLQSWAKVADAVRPASNVELLVNHPVSSPTSERGK